jgi:hypothetical protein
MPPRPSSGPTTNLPSLGLVRSADHAGGWREGFGRSRVEDGGIIFDQSTWNATIPTAEKEGFTFFGYQNATR